jgi:hypothetical protein
VGDEDSALCGYIERVAEGWCQTVRIGIGGQLPDDAEIAKWSEPIVIVSATSVTMEVVETVRTYLEGFWPA